MKNKQTSIGIFIIASAIIWGVVIIGCAMALNGGGNFSDIRNILYGGVISHLILIWGPMGVLFKKGKEDAHSSGQKE